MIEKIRDDGVCAEYLKKMTFQKSFRFRLSERDEAMIRNSVATLPPQERVAIYLHFWEGSSIAQIAAALNVSQNFASNLIRLGLELLKPKLNSFIHDQMPTLAVERLAA